MAKEWKAIGPDEKIEWLYAALQSIEKAVGATQNDLSGLSRRVVERDLQQKSI